MTATTRVPTPSRLALPSRETVWTWLPRLLPFLVPLVLFGPALVGERLIAPGDAWAYAIPTHETAEQLWRDGGGPWWNPNAFGGMPFLATGQSGALYPLFALHFVLPPALAQSWIFVLHFLIAAGGMFLLARRLTGDEWAAAVAAIALSLAGFMFARLAHEGMVVAAAWFPWTILGAELVRERVTPRRVAAAVLPLTLMLLGGHPQMFFVFIAGLAIYLLTLAVVARGRRLVSAVLPFAMVGGAGALAAVQIVPVMRYLPGTPRDEVPYEEASRSSALLVQDLIQQLFPFIRGTPNPTGPFADYEPTVLFFFEELIAYPGIATLLLALAALVRIASEPRILALLLMAVFGVVAALGATTPLSHVIYALPIYGQFTGWARFLAIAVFAIALLAGFGVAHLRRATGWSRIAAVGVLVVGLGGAWLAGLLIPPWLAPSVHYGGRAIILVLVPLAGATAMVLAAIAMLRWPRAGALALCLAVMAELTAFGAFAPWRSSPAPAVIDAWADPRQPLSWGTLADAPGGIDRVFLTTNGVKETPNWSQPKGWRSLTAYEPLARTEYLEAMGDMSWLGSVVGADRLVHPRSLALDVMRVSTVITEDDTPQNHPTHPGARWIGYVDQERGLVRYEVVPRLEDAYLVGRAQRMTRSGSINVLQGRHRIAATREAVYDGTCRPCERLTRPGASGTVGERDWGAGEVSMEIDAARAGLLVVSQAWAPGWSAEIDGEDAPVVRANGVATAVPVPAGKHEVRLAYSPPGLRAGFAISLLTLLAFGGWVVLRRRRGAVSGPAPARPGTGSPAAP